jgi:hypothetical protein
MDLGTKRRRSPQRASKDMRTPRQQASEAAKSKRGDPVVEYD